MHSQRVDDPGVDESVGIARRIISIPPGEVAESIRFMLRKRQLSMAVRGLNSLVLDHPQHRLVAQKALDRLGLWP